MFKPICTILVHYALRTSTPQILLKSAVGIILGSAPEKLEHHVWLTLKNCNTILDACRCITNPSATQSHPSISRKAHKFHNFCLTTTAPLLEVAVSILSKTNHSTQLIHLHSQRCDFVIFQLVQGIQALGFFVAPSQRWGQRPGQNQMRRGSLPHACSTTGSGDSQTH